MVASVLSLTVRKAKVTVKDIFLHALRSKGASHLIG